MKSTSVEKINKLSYSIQSHSLWIHILIDLKRMFPKCKSFLRAKRRKTENKALIHKKKEIKKGGRKKGKKEDNEIKEEIEIRKI